MIRNAPISQGRHHAIARESLAALTVRRGMARAPQVSPKEGDMEEHMEINGFA
jgi:hypothetical protein